jgi:putative transposase
MKRHGSADVFVTDKLRSYCVVPCWLVALQSPAGQWMKDAMTAQMVTHALMMAIWGRGRPKELLHHSDQGSQYTSEAVQRIMEDYGVTCSMSRSGNVWDNAAVERFFSTLKIERVRRKVYRTRDQARADVFDYIERFYNPTRRHSTIGYISPMEYEE